MSVCFRKTVFPRNVVILICAALLSACSMTAPQYQSDFEMINTLKDIPLEKMRVGEFISADKDADKISIRGSSLNSPFNNSYSAYLGNALTEELKQSGLWEDSSSIVVTGELLTNEVDAAGFSIGEADISARFHVDRNEQQVYDKVHQIHHEWDSSFFGNVAIPNAINNYPIAVQKLINEFLLDIDLLRAVTEQTGPPNENM